MLLQAAIDFGLSVSVMDSDAHCVCSRYTNSFVHGSPQNFHDVVAFGQHCDLLTFEIESVSVDALTTLEGQGINVYPSPQTLHVIQDKYRQKQFLINHNLPTTPCVPIDGRQLLSHLELSYPWVLKLRTGGYDGRGVMIIRSDADLEQAFDASAIAEPFVKIEQEIAVIVARNDAGQIECFDPVSMVFDDHLNLLAYQTAPANISEDVSSRAVALAFQVAEAISLIGILAVEMFLTKAGELLINELAPRPHNSGHHSIEACTTSQYQQHLRAILNLPLGNPKTLRPSALVNIISPDNTRFPSDGMLASLLAVPDAYLHLYGKQPRKGRKLGHITVTSDTYAQAVDKAHTIRKILNPNP